MELAEVPNIAASARRLWLLLKAIQRKPLDEALELARAAEAFIAGEQPQPSAEPLQALESPPEPKSVGFVATIKPEDREAIIKLLAAGQKNREIQADFPHLGLRQIQGVRMGTARRIKATAAAAAETVGNGLSEELEAAAPAYSEAAAPAYSEAAAPASAVPVYSAGIDDVVRYLRRQDDVVVQDGDHFIVNTRFRLSEAELLERANRMRGRKNEPVFQVQTAA